MATAPQPQAATVNQIRAEALVERIFGDPEFAGLAPELHKVANKMFGDIKEPPAVSIKKTVAPEVDAIRAENESLKEGLKKALERLDARDKADEETKTFREMESAVNAAVTKYNLTEEGRQKMLDRMKDRQNYTDPDAAAAAVAHDMPPPASSGPSWLPKKANFYGSADPEESFRKLHSDPVGYADDEISRFLKNPAGYAAEAA